MTSDMFTVTGTITDTSGAPLAGVLVRVTGLEQSGAATVLGERTTGDDGRYRVPVCGPDDGGHEGGGGDGHGDGHGGTPAPAPVPAAEPAADLSATVVVRQFGDAAGAGEPGPAGTGGSATGGQGGQGGGDGGSQLPYQDIRVEALIGDRVMASAGPVPIQRPETRVDLRVDRDAVDLHPCGDFWVHGTVRDQNGKLMQGVTVRAVDRHLRREDPLGSCPVTDGRYEIHYGAEQLRRADAGSADIVIIVVDAAGAVLYRTGVTYNAPPDCEIDVSLAGAVYAGPSEWEVETGTLTPLLDGLSPLDLREDAEFQDVSFLTGETGYSALTVGTWAACWRLTDRVRRDDMTFPPEAFFAFLHQGEPSIFKESLLTDVQHPERVVLIEDALLRALATMPAGRQEQVLNKAVDGNLVPVALRAEIKDLLATLQRMRLKYTGDTTIGGGKGTIGQLLGVAEVPAPQQQTILSAMATHVGPLADLWKKLEQDPSLPAPTVEKVKTAVEVGSLTRNHVPLVGALLPDLTAGHLTKRQLAQYSQQDWFAVFARPQPDGTPVGVPDNIDGGTPAEKQATYAAILDQQFERAYPTASLAAKIRHAHTAAAAMSTGPLNLRLAEFLDANPKFLLDKHRLDQFLAGAPTTTPTPTPTPGPAPAPSPIIRDAALEPGPGRAAAATIDPGLRQDVLSAQRVFKLQPTFAATNAMLSKGIDSAQRIYFMGEGQFATAMAGTPVNRLSARVIYNKAEFAYAHALSIYGDLNLALNGPALAGLPAQNLDPETESKLRALPNLRTLFGSLDYCDCSDCQSVYSPAAHFVDVLRFLGDRGTQGTGANAGKSVRDVLLGRRPDLGDIELSCPNTNTPLPYIDLVNEILEDVVSPPAAVTLDAAIEPKLVEGKIAPEVLAELTAKGVPIAKDAYVYAPDVNSRWVIRDDSHSYSVAVSGAALALRSTRQTVGSADEVRANPEHVNDAAYTKLAGEVFPFSVPFDLADQQARGYLDQLGVPQARLCELLQQSPSPAAFTPTDLQIDAARLGLGDVERQIVTGTLPGRQPWEYWGLAETANTIPDPNDPTQTITGTWLQLLAMVPVLLNRSGLAYRQLLQLLDSRFVNPTGSVAIAGSDAPNAALCDISTFTITGLTADVAGRIHRFLRLWRRVGGTMWDLDLYLSNQNLDDVTFRAIAALRRVADRTGLDWATVVTVYRGFDDRQYVDRGTGEGVPVQTLYQKLFRNRLVDSTGVMPPTVAGLSGTIGDHVPSLLAGLRVTEADLDLILADRTLTLTSPLDEPTLALLHQITALARGFGLPVAQFLRLVRISGTDPGVSPLTAVAFGELVDTVTASAFSVPELDYLLTHHYTVNSGVALDDRAVVAFLSQLRQGLAKIADQLRHKADESDTSYVKTRLGLLTALAADADLRAAQALIDGSWAGTVADRNALIDRLFAGVFPDLGAAHTALAELPSGDTPEQRQARIDARYAFVAPLLEQVLLTTHKDLFVQQQVAAFLKLDEPSTTVLLTTLHVPGGTALLDTAINDPRLLTTLPDGTYQYPLDATTFPDVYAALRLLHKVAMIARKLTLTPAEVTWWLAGTHADDLGWINAAGLGVDTTVVVPLARWSALNWFFGWRAGLPSSTLTALDFATELLHTGAPSADTVTALAKLTAWNATDITTLTKAFGWLTSTTDTVKTELAHYRNLQRVADCMAALRRLGVTAVRAVGWATVTPGPDVAEQIKQALKARYDLPQWLDANRPVQDALREQRRDVLVDWLVAHPDPANGRNWTDVNGLYSYFLIDVEMSACALTSRLKQATGSAQLFVQRVLLNLEDDILASTAVDPKWKQWKWMNRYRFWEANRKIFLYPENWIEPELRDEKSPFFLGLEHDLQQSDITADTAEEAYRTYLGKLDKVANLEIRAMFEERRGDNSLLHVVGRTRASAGAEYFYRTRVDKARWTAWQPVGVEIKADHLQLGLHNRRLSLLWPQFLEKAVEPTSVSTPQANSSTSVTAPNRYWDIQMFWSELKNGTWTPKVLSDQPIGVAFYSAAGDKMNLSFRTRLAPQIQAVLYSSVNPSASAPLGDEGFEKLGPQVHPITFNLLEYLISPPQSKFSGNLILHQTGSQFFYYNSTVETGKAHTLPAHQNAESIQLLANIDPSKTYTVLDSAAFGFADSGSFFTWDPRRTYFVDYEHHTYWSYWSHAWHTWAVSSFRYFPHYHPFVELFIKELNVWGLPGLLNRTIQVAPETVPDAPTPFNFQDYQPQAVVPQNTWPVEDVDFTYLGAYSMYNWELFFHAPMLIAGKLAANQRFEDALAWYQCVFDPTSTDTAVANPDTPQQKFWITKPFYLTTKADYYKQKIENMLLAIAKGDAELRAQVAEWRDHPYNPHLIARMRTVAYQKNVLVKYIKTLIAWGDQLFGQDTIESINEATQLYVLAAEILGPRPTSVPRRVPNPVRTFYQLQAAGIDDFGNSLREVENLLPPSPGPGGPGPGGPELPKLDVLYFGIPTNDALLTLWDTVDDRLFKIRHCMNLAGVVRQLPLFEPPIDPALLVKAAAAGLDLGAVLGDLGAPMPAYRFSVLMQKAHEACAAVISLGAAMLNALDKQDAEALAALRSSHEIVLLDLMRDVRLSRIDEAQANYTGAQRHRDVIDQRRAHYQQMQDDGLNTGEITALALSGTSLALEAAVAVGYVLSGGLKLIPNFLAGAAGFGGSPTVNVTMGGSTIGNGAEMAVATLRSIATAAEKGAGLATVLAGHARRSQDWKFQTDQATADLPEADQQILAAQIRHTIAQQELKHHDKQRDNAQAQDDFLHDKFTNTELFTWLVDQLSTVYFQSYQLAYDLAKRAERCFRYELGLTDSNYVRFGYWDSLRKGLSAGERLAHDLRRLDAAYLDQNHREYELTKHVSLAQLDPVALLQLKRNGECLVDIPEAVFDLDHPGQYFRRLKTVSLSVPCVVGPYGTVGCTLTLTGDSLRKDSTLLAGKYTRDPGGDTRFRDGISTIQSIATSSGTDDSGLFELRFEDQRYLPFEGAGAISSWHLRLNADVPQFDVSSISDVVIHLRYTAREGGDALRAQALKDLGTTLSTEALAAGRHGLYRVLDLRREFPDEFARFRHPANPADDQMLDLGDLSAKLPWFTRSFTGKKIRAVEVAAQMADNATFEVQLAPLGTTPADLLTLAPDPTYHGMDRAAKDLTGSEAPLTGWTLKLRKQGAADWHSLPPDAAQELFLIINYTLVP